MRMPTFMNLWVFLLILLSQASAEAVGSFEDLRGFDGQSSPLLLRKRPATQQFTGTPVANASGSSTTRIQPPEPPSLSDPLVRDVLLAEHARNLQQRRLSLSTQDNTQETAEEINVTAQAFQAWQAEQNGTGSAFQTSSQSYTINVYFWILETQHIASNYPQDSSNLRDTGALIQTLNDGYADTAFTFASAGESVVVNDYLYFNCPFISKAGVDEITTLYRTDIHQNTLNVYLCNGMSTWGVMMGRQGVTNRYRYVFIGHWLHFNGVQYIETGLADKTPKIGQTLIHQVGHWLGLPNTYGRSGEGCNGPGDAIQDTPTHNGPSWGKPGHEHCFSGATLDTCPDQTGLDPVNNYMNLAAPICWEHHGYLYDCLHRVGNALRTAPAPLIPRPFSPDSTTGQKEFMLGTWESYVYLPPAEPDLVTAHAWRLRTDTGDALVASATGTKRWFVNDIKFYSAADCAEASKLYLAGGSATAISSVDLLKEVDTSISDFWGQNEQAFNGMVDTFWAWESFEGEDLWIGMDFKVDVDIKCVKFMQTVGHYASAVVLDAKRQGESYWTPVQTFTGLHGGATYNTLLTETPSPTSGPSGLPSATPSRAPSPAPSGSPSGLPSATPSKAPSPAPSGSPSSIPSKPPSPVPSGLPSNSPSKAPVPAPTSSPSASPVVAPSFHPSGSPSGSPIASPTKLPSFHPTGSPSASPVASPTGLPSKAPIPAPTHRPSAAPATGPPSPAPFPAPTRAPSVAPTPMPTRAPFPAPTSLPTFPPPSAAPVPPPTTAPTPGTFGGAPPVPPSTRRPSTAPPSPGSAAGFMLAPTTRPPTFSPVPGPVPAAQNNKRNDCTGVKLLVTACMMDNDCCPDQICRGNGNSKTCQLCAGPGAKCASTADCCSPDTMLHCGRGDMCIKCKLTGFCNQPSDCCAMKMCSLEPGKDMKMCY